MKLTGLGMKHQGALLKAILPFLFGSLLPVFWPVTIQAQDALGPPGTRFYAAAVEEEPVLDGLVDEELWNLAEPATAFIQQQPVEGEPSTELTQVRVVYTERNLYLGIICFDRQPEGIVVSQGRRDGELTDTDSILILLDTFNDNQNAFIFGTNPFAVEYDGQVVREGRSAGTGFAGGTYRSVGQASTQRGGITGFNLNWDGEWTVRSQITGRGWESEIAIPFKTLRYSEGKEQVWGINVMRNIRRKNEQSFLAPVSRAESIYRVSKAADLVISPPPARTLQMIPYGLGGVAKDYRDGSRDFKRDAGLDAKYGVTSELTLDLTFNTDFAQVEVDEEQVNLSRFDLFFPEKRPFFLENSGFFQFGTPREMELFFTRRIGIDRFGAEIPLLGGARLSGKLDRFNLGLLTMQSEEVEGIAPANNFLVARLSRELRTRSAVGFMFVNRTATTSEHYGHEKYNRAWGFDGQFGLGENLTLFSYLANTDSPHLDGGDFAGRLFLDYNGPLWRITTGYGEVGENFNPEVGFVPRRGYRKPELRVEFGPEPDWPHVRKLSPHVTFNRYYGMDGLLESEFQHYDYEMYFNNGARLGCTVNSRFEALREPFEVFPGIAIPLGSYRYTDISWDGSTDPSAPVFLEGQYTRGGFYDGTLRAWDLQGGFRWGAKMLTTLRYTINDVDLPADNFRTHLAAAKVSYSFGPDKYLQALIQYNNRFQLLTSNIRFGLIRKSGTGFFIVYNEQYETLHGGFPVLNRVLLLKYTQLFNF